jgi:predicted transcriptional regulator
MNEKFAVVRGRVDAVDETILLALKEGEQSLKNLHVLSGINYNTFRQRLDKLLRYKYIAKPGYGKYALTEKGKRFVEELTISVATDLKDPNLKKLIDLLPTELHRAFFRLVLSGVIAKYHLSDVYDDGYPAFILGGETKSFKTALANVMCKLLGLKPEENIYPLFSAIAGEFGIRRFRDKGDNFHIAASPLFKQSFVCLDEFDKVTERDTKRNVLFFLDGRQNFLVEGQLVENNVCIMLTLNTKIGKECIARFGIPEPYIRRSIVADTEHVRVELKDVDLVAKKIFEMKDFPRIDLGRLHLIHSELPNDMFTCLRNLLIGCTDDSFQGLIDTRPLVMLTLGRSVLLGGDAREAMYQTLWDRLTCLESLGGTEAGWRETVAQRWARYKREEQPEIEKQLSEAEKKEKERKQALAQRTATIEKRKSSRLILRLPSFFTVLS